MCTDKDGYGGSNNSYSTLVFIPCYTIKPSNNQQSAYALNARRVYHLLSMSSFYYSQQFKTRIRSLTSSSSPQNTQQRQPDVRDAMVTCQILGEYFKLCYLKTNMSTELVNQMTLYSKHTTESRIKMTFEFMSTKISQYSNPTDKKILRTLPDMKYIVLITTSLLWYNLAIPTYIMDQLIKNNKKITEQQASQIFIDQCITLKLFDLWKHSIKQTNSNINNDPVIDIIKDIYIACCQIMFGTSTTNNNSKKV